jgi:DNA-binding CsgD family transcriptional regulator
LIGDVLAHDFELSQLAGILAFVATFAAAYYFSNHFAWFHKRAAFVLILVLAVLRAISIVAPLADFWLDFWLAGLVLDILLGCSAAYVFISLVSAFKLVANEWLGYLLSASMVIAVLIGFFIQSLSQPWADFCGLLCFAVALVALITFSKSSPMSEDSSKSQSGSRIVLHAKTTVQVGLFGASSGIALFAIFWAGSLLAATFGVLLGAILCLAMFQYDQGANGEKATKRFAILQIACYLVVPFTSGVASLAVWAVLLGASFGYLMFHWNWVVITGHRFKLNMVYHLSKSERAWFEGSLSSFLLCLVFWNAGFTANVLNSAMVLLLAISIFYLIVDDKENLRLFTYKMHEESTETDIKHAGRFYNRCIATASIYGLTPRETEVLIMMAKGRNAEFIRNELVISNHTAKSHIHNIYQKMDISSHQRLMDIVDGLGDKQ